MRMRTSRLASTLASREYETCSSVIKDLDLYGLRRRIRGRLERLYTVLKCETMCDQRLDIDQPRLNETDGLWIGVLVPVLKFQVDFSCRHERERDGLEILAAADHEDGAAECCRLQVISLRQVKGVG